MADIWSIVLLIGLLGLAWIALKAAWTGRLDYMGGKLTDFTETAPLLRRENPAKFWVVWASIAIVSLVPFGVILVRAISYLVFGNAQD